MGECAMGSENAMSPAPNCWGALACLPFFVAGVVALAVIELLAILYLLQRLLKPSAEPSASPVSDLTIESSENSISVQGKAWVSPLPDGVRLSKLIIRREKEKEAGQKVREDMVEIAPVRMQAVLKDKTLYLTNANGIQETISLEGCEILSVSSSPEPSRKWGKKYPIKVRHPDRNLYHGSKTLLFFSESGYAKEAWCEAFRAMARIDRSAKTFETKRKYRDYTRAAEENMPYLTNFYAADESKLVDVKQKEDLGGPSRARKLTDKWKRLTRKVSIGREAKPMQAVDEANRRKDKKYKDTVEIEDVSQVDPNFDRYRDCEGERSGNGSEGNDTHDQVPVKDGRVGKEIEQGVLCMNMVVARLFYDFNQNPRRLASVERFYQRLLMKIRSPSYIKSINIKEFDMGRHPPFATAVRMLPPDADGALAVELDLQWRGGGHLTCETRVDLREQSAQEKVVSQLTGSGSEQDAAAALLSDMRVDLDAMSSGNFSAALQEGQKPGDNEGSNRKGRTMSMMSRVAERLSQVAIVLKIRLVSIKGTVVLKLKAPPSDRVWFAFKTMPEIHFEHIPCIGERRISSTALGDMISKQIKIQIRESVVLPYCEDFFLDWMVADKENWLPISAFPLPFFASQLSEAERKLFKRNAETPSTSSSDESGRHQNNKGPSKAQKHAHFSHANSQASVRPRRTNSEHSIFHFASSNVSRSASSEQLHTLASKPPRQPSSAAHLSAAASDPVQATAFPLGTLSGNKEIMPDDFLKEEKSGSAADSEPGTFMDSRAKDFSIYSEGSVSESDAHFLETQVANPEGVKGPLHVVPLTRRSKVTRALDEGRRHVKDKLHRRRPDDLDGSSHHHPSGRRAHEHP